MADTGKAFTKVGSYANAEKYEWQGMTTGDVGEWVRSNSFGDRCVSVIGTIGGATISWEGTSGDPNMPGTPAAFPLHDPFGNVLTTAANEGKTVLQTPLAVRPKVTGGSGVDCTPQLFARRTQR
jgi:hypothetical protein